MRCNLALAWIGLLLATPAASAYIEAPYSLGQICNESTTIVLVEVTRVNKEKNLVLYQKVRDLKGKHPQDVIKHNVGQRGRHPREWQAVMAWAEVGKKAVFFHNGQASVTCIGPSWYQCFPEGEWWAMSHAEPYLLRTYCGDVDRLVTAIDRMHKGEEVIVPCMAAATAEQLQQGKGKLQRLKASLKRLDYNPKRDFVAFGAGGDEPELETVVLLGQGTPGWRFLPAAAVKDVGERWRKPEFDDKSWKTGKAPIGYGEEELRKRKGTVVTEHGVPFVFRREVKVPADLLKHKGIAFHLDVASDDGSSVYVNGTLVDEDPVKSHEFAYWNREIALQPSQLKPGRNVVAVLVHNTPNSSDAYLDAELRATYPRPTPPRATVASAANQPKTAAPQAPPAEEKEQPGALTVDKTKRTLTVACTIAPRKLPNLADTYPIEVIACYPAPRGQKAHETIVTFTGVKPSSVHKALIELGRKPGKPAANTGAQAEGPELKIFLEFTSADGKTQRLPIEQTLVNQKTNQPVGALKWHFTGSLLKQPDPEKDEKVYGADVTGTLITILPVTAECVIQSNLKAEAEGTFKLETRRDLLPKEGSPARLIIEVR